MPPRRIGAEEPEVRFHDMITVALGDHILAM
jgi:hypothetical protein